METKRVGLVGLSLLLLAAGAFTVPGVSKDKKAAFAMAHSVPNPYLDQVRGWMREAGVVDASILGPERAIQLSGEDPDGKDPDLSSYVDLRRVLEKAEKGPYPKTVLVGVYMEPDGQVGWCGLKIIVRAKLTRVFCVSADGTSGPLSGERDIPPAS